MSFKWQFKKLNLKMWTFYFTHLLHCTVVKICWNFTYEGIFFQIQNVIVQVSYSISLFVSVGYIFTYICCNFLDYCTPAGAGGKYEGMKIAELRADILSNSSTGLSDGRSSYESTILLYMHPFFWWRYSYIHSWHLL